jgi:hypothetical protein
MTTRGAARTPRVGVLVPFGELQQEIGVVLEAALFEKRPLDPADQILDRAFLVAAARPADLGGNPEFDHDVDERGVPLGDVAVSVPLDGHRLRPIEHRQQRHAAEHIEVPDQGPYERLDLFVGHERHRDEPRILEPRRKKVSPARRPVHEPDVDVSEVMLGKLAGKTLEPDQGPRHRRPQCSDQIVDRRLATRVALQLGAAQQLQ